MSLFRQLLARSSVAQRRAFSSSGAAAAEEAVAAYATPVKVMHWVMGFSVSGAVGSVMAAQQAGKEQFLGQSRGQWMWFHKSCGLLAGMLLLPRVGLRLASKAPPHIPTPIPGSAYLAEASHWALYGFMATMAGTGITMGYYNGMGLPFFWTKLDGANESSPETAKAAFGWHKLIGTYGKFLVPMHVAGAGYHTVAGHTIWPRIVPGL